MTSTTVEIWGPPILLTERPNGFWFSGSPPPPWFIKVNFNRSVTDRHGSASFIIHGLGLRLVATRSYLFELAIPAIEIYGAWARITYAWKILLTDHLIIESDSAMIVTWIQESVQRESVHPLPRDIAALLIGCIAITIRYVYWEVNSVANWVAFYIAEHSKNFLWTDLGEVPGQFRDIILSNFLKNIHIRPL